MENILECKVCGGNLIPENDGITAVCESCGTRSAMPKASTNSNKINRANALRRACEFDKAASVFEEIINENTEDSEAYWGLVLCKFGIEYVDDADGTKKPTCHRTMFDSILDDVDYKAAIEYAVGITKYIYEDEAKKIDDIQRKIKAIAANEKPYDIFICYKESDEFGQRTHDSVDTQEIYNRLTARGYKVFFARKTLQNKLGEEYEPIIFAALNSAKVMLVYGSSPDFFNAVWVKNEWSRFRRMVADSSNKKVLIPIYDGTSMKIYDLPNELIDFQSFDKSKLGFMEDLISGLEKVLVKEQKPAETGRAAQQTVVQVEGAANLDNLFERAKMFTEDGSWQKADEYYEKILDMSPKSAKAYFGKLMVEFKAKNENELIDKDSFICESNNFKKASTYADDDLSYKLEVLSEKNKEKCCEKIYNQACGRLSEMTTIEQAQSLENLFRGLSGYKDSEEKADICKQRVIKFKVDELIAEKNKIDSTDDVGYLKLAEKFDNIKNSSDAARLAAECRAAAEAIRRKRESDKKISTGCSCAGFGIIAVIVIYIIATKGLLIGIITGVVMLAIVGYFMGETEKDGKKQNTKGKGKNGGK